MILFLLASTWALADVTHFGVIQKDCSPSGGPAVHIVITDKKMTCADDFYPRVEVSYWKSIPSAAPYEFVIEGELEIGSFATCKNRGSCKTNRSGRIEFTEITPQKLVGHFRTQAAKGSPIKGEFELIWCDGRKACW